MFELHTDILKQMFGEAHEISEDAIDTVNMMLYIKDWYNVSDCAHHEFARYILKCHGNTSLRKGYPH